MHRVVFCRVMSCTVLSCAIWYHIMCCVLLCHVTFSSAPLSCTFKDAALLNDPYIRYKALYGRFLRRIFIIDKLIVVSYIYRSISCEHTWLYEFTYKSRNFFYESSLLMFQGKDVSRSIRNSRRVSLRLKILLQPVSM